MRKNAPVFRWGIPLILPLLFMASVVLATRTAAAASGTGAGPGRQSWQAGRLMAQTQDVKAHQVKIPPLDLHVQAHIETATFALG